jgi:peptidyl-prolyl cis-trans isomerase D
MLRQLSRLERTRSLVILFFAFLLAISLVFFYAAPSNRGGNLLSGSEVLASVDGEEILVSDIRRRRESMSRNYAQYGIDLASLGIDDERLLEGLVRDRIVTSEAVRLGLGVSDEELGARIRELYRDGGQFIGADKYKQIAVERYGSVEKLESELRDALAQEKLRAFVTAGVQVSPAEVEEQYKRQNSTFDIVYVPVVADKLTKQINPTDDDLKQFYEAHKTDYRVLEGQKKIRYVFIETSKVGEKLNISDEDLKTEYDSLPPDAKRAGVKVQMIVLKVAKPELDADVKAKADALVQRARDKGGMSAEAFAELARGNSEDPATAPRGGEVGVVKKSQAKPNDPLQNALTMPPNGISDAIKYQNAYYILRRGEDVPKTFAEAKQELLVSSRNRKGYAAAAELARKAAEKLKQVKDVQKVAQEMAGEANMKPEDMVRDTGFIKPGDNVKDGIGNNAQFEAGIAPLNNVGDVGDQTQIPNGFAVPMLVEKRDGNYLPALDEVKDKVTDAFKQDRAKNQLEQFAQDVAKAAGNAGGLKAAAEKIGLEAKTNDKYKLGGSFDVAGGSGAADDALFKMKDGEVSPAFKTTDNYLVIGLNKRTDADMKEFDKQKDTLTTSALDTRRSQVFEDYISALQERMKADGRIKIQRDLLEQMMEEAPPPAPRRPNFPFQGGDGSLPINPAPAEPQPAPKPDAKPKGAPPKGKDKGK